MMQMGAARNTPVIATQAVPMVNASLPVVRAYRETLSRLFRRAATPLSLAGFIAARYTYEVLSEIDGPLTRERALAAFQRRANKDIGGYPRELQPEAAQRQLRDAKHADPGRACRRLSPAHPDIHPRPHVFISLMRQPVERRRLSRAAQLEWSRSRPAARLCADRRRIGPRPFAVHAMRRRAGLPGQLAGVPRPARPGTARPGGRAFTAALE